MTRVVVHRYDLPLSAPFRIAYDTVTHSRNLLVRAESDGLHGFGEAGPVPTITGEDQERALQDLRAWVADGGPTEGHAGTRPRGIAAALAAETALLDLEAKQAEVPLCTHLGGGPAGPVETSITVPLMTPDEAGALAARHRTEGFTVFKVKAGAGLEEDMARIGHVREAVGAGAELRVDANQGWSRQEARDALPMLADLDVAVLEQPLHKDDLEGHRDLRGAGVPIMLDESVFNSDDARRALDAGACDRINIKLQKAGGLREALAIASLAADADVPCMLGCMIESRVGILAGAHVVAAHDNILWADLDGHTFLAGDPVAGGAAIRDGVIRLDQGAGLGIDGVKVDEPPRAG